MDGVGAALNAGRWNPIGIKMVYCAESLALAVLEIRVHLAIARPKGRFIGVKVLLAASAIEYPDPSSLPSDWRQAPETSTVHTSARRFGARWISERRSVAIQLPSAVIPTESIYLLNPEHPDFAGAVQIVGTVSVSLDDRLWS
jgi:RES domain-containing protein